MNTPAPRAPRVVVITGAGGLIGSALARALARAGWHVRALVRDTGSAAARALVHDADAGAGAGAGRVEVFHADLPDALDPAAFEGLGAHDVVLHAAYATRSAAGGSARERATNEEGTRKVLDAARARGARLVFISSLAADPAARAYYARSKGEIEAWLDPARDLVVRPGLVLDAQRGLFARLVEQVRRSSFIPLIAGGAQPVQTIHVDDLTCGLRRALEGGLTGVLRLAEEHPITMKDLLTEVARRLGRAPRFVPVPAGALMLGLRASAFLGLPVPISRENVLGLLAMRAQSVRDDLDRVGLTPRGARASLDELFGTLKPA